MGKIGPLPESFWDGVRLALMDAEVLVRKQGMYLIARGLEYEGDNAPSGP
jgi:hypothetical protein